MRRLVLSLLLPIVGFACSVPDHIEIDPGAPHLTHKGEAVRLHGKVMDRAGKVYGRERAFFTSRDPKVAAVNEHGDLTAVGSGHTVVEARAGSLYAEMPVEVELIEGLLAEQQRIELTPEDDAIKVPVRVLGHDGRALVGREVTFTTDDPRVARVDPEGKVWGLTPGDTLLKARVDDKLAVIEVHVAEASRARQAAHRDR
jgi:hypothetical protein